LPDRMKLIAAPGENFVRVGLVTDIPDKLIVRRAEDIMKGHGKFDGTKPGPQVSSDLGDRVDEEFPQFGADNLQLRDSQLPEILRGIDMGEVLLLPAGRLIRSRR